jgi:hypothetical protein
LKTRLSYYVIFTISLFLFLCPLFLGERVQATIYSLPTGTCNIEITNIDESTKTLEAHLVMEDPTSPVFPDRSTSMIVFQFSGMTYSDIIMKNDPDWQLVGTNTENDSYWKIEKDYYFQYNSSGPFYPFEQFKAGFYFASNMTHGFNVVSSVPNYLVNASPTDIKAVQFPTNIELGYFYSNVTAQGLFLTSKVTITMKSQDVAVQAASMIYVLFVVLIAVAFLLIWLVWKKTISFSNSITITTGVLFFLPILLFTFRTSIAPKYLTPIDTGSFILILLYGILLCIELASKIYREKKPQEDKSMEDKYMVV